MSQLPGSTSTRAEARAQRRAIQMRRWVVAMVVGVLSAVGLVGAVSPLAVAANNCGEGVDTCGTVDKEVIDPKPVYQVGDSVTYRLTLQCSSLVGNCGIGTVTDVFDPNLQIPAGAVVLPNPRPFPMSPSWSGNTLTLTLGSASTPWPDGPATAVYVTAIVKDYPLTAPVGVINNQATVTMTADGNTLDSAIVPIKVAEPDRDFGLYKSSASGVAPGETYSFQMKFTRPTKVGGIDVTSAVVTDPLPQDLEYVTSWTAYAPGSATSYDSATHTVTWNLATIPARSDINCDAQGLNCSTYTTLYVTVKVPPNARTSSMPAGGTVYTNKATAVLTYKDGETQTVSATGTLSTAAPQPNTEFLKLGPAKVAPGGNISWRVYLRNNGNTTLTDATVTDTLPTNTLESLSLTRIYWDLNPLNPGGGSVTFQFSSDGGSTWGSTTVVDSTLPTPSAIPVPTGSTHWRMSTPTLKPGVLMDMYVTAKVPDGTSLDDTIVNCATATSTTPGLTPPGERCVTTAVDPAEAFLTPIKGLKITGPNAPTSVTPLEVFDWIVGFAVHSSTPVKTATLSDVIPPQFEVLEVTCFSTRGTGSGEGSSVIDAPCPSTRPIPPHTIVVLPDGSGTLVTFKDMELPADTLAGQNSTGYSLHIQVAVKPGTSVADYTNTVKVNTNDQVTTCNTSWYVKTETTDPADIDGDGITNETVCTNSAVVKVIEAETVQVRKWDIGDPTLPNIFEDTGTINPPADSLDTACPNWDGFTRYPCVAQTLPGGSFSYRVEMQNVGNVPMTDYVLYDVLPVIGDKGVGQLLSGGQRGTEWSPVLTGPVVLEPSLTTATNSAYVVEYNLTSNPCRPELNLNDTTPDAPWQATCDDTWYSQAQISDWSSVKSYRIKLFQETAGGFPEWAAGKSLVFVVPMKAPLSAPQSTFDPLNLSVAWNSVAYRGHRVMADADPLWLKPSEPRKVGIVVPFTIPPAVSVGDYFWYDADSDGIQDADESPVKDAVVRLLDKDGNEVSATTTNANGYYSFINLTPDTDYIIEFVKPDGYLFTTKDASGDSTNSRTADLTDSDVDPTTGRVAFNSGPAGENLPGGPTSDDAGTDNPGLDAGLIQPKMNLQLQKSGGTWTGLLIPGTEVTWTLTPNNEGSTAAQAGWSVTDVLPAGLEIVSMAGTGYTCDIATTPASPVCTASAGLAAGATGEPITVVTKVATGWTGSSFHNVAYVDKAPNDTTETNPLVTPTTTTDTSTTNTDNDAQASINVVSVGDYVWYDVNRDGLQTAGESAYVGMTVELYAADGTTKLATTTTDAGGYYSFTGLKPSTAYVIKFVKKADETFTTTNAGGTATNSPTGDITDSDAARADGTVAFTTTATGSNLASSVTAGVKADNPGIDAGVVRYNLVLDKALTSSGPYYEGGTVTYSLTPSNDGPVDALKGWSVTDILPAGLTLVSMTGTGYDCSTTPGTCVSKDTGLAAGQKGNVITVTATINANVTGDLKNVAYVDKAPTDEPETNPLGDKPTVDTETGQTPTDNDDQEKITVLSKVSIGDYVWLDTNRDGLQTPGELALAGITVTLTDSSGATRTTATDGTGYYWFDDLTPGAAYTLTFTKPTGYVWTTQNVAGDTADKDAGTDSDVNPADGKVSFTAPTSGSNRTGAMVTDNPTIDAGLIELVSIGDYVWWDRDLDGLQSEGEPVVAGVTVNLLDAD